MKITGKNKFLYHRYIHYINNWQLSHNMLKCRYKGQNNYAKKNQI